MIIDLVQKVHVLRAKVCELCYILTTTRANSGLKVNSISEAVSVGFLDILLSPCSPTSSYMQLIKANGYEHSNWLSLPLIGQGVKTGKKSFTNPSTHVSPSILRNLARSKRMQNSSEGDAKKILTVYSKLVNFLPFINDNLISTFDINFHS